MTYDKRGRLNVKTTTAGGALPVVNTLVRIFGSDEENKNINYSVLTDRDGQTGEIELPAPPLYLSMYPGATEQSFAKYDIEIIKSNYYTKKIFDVAIFADNASFLPIEMIPIPKNKTAVTYPRGSLNAVVEENEKLGGYQ